MLFPAPHLPIQMLVLAARPSSLLWRVASQFIRRIPSTDGLAAGDGVSRMSYASPAAKLLLRFDFGFGLFRVVCVVFGFFVSLVVWIRRRIYAVSLLQCPSQEIQRVW